jgi:purine nucleoside permease
MEDSGFLQAIERLDRMRRVDAKRVLVLRTGSNYSMPRPGHTAVESVTAPYIGSKLSLEAAWLCGSTVLHQILEHWDVTATRVPGD